MPRIQATVLMIALRRALCSFLDCASHRLLYAAVGGKVPAAVVSAGGQGSDNDAGMGLVQTSAEQRGEIVPYW